MSHTTDDSQASLTHKRRLARGLNASPGVATGRIVFDAEAAIADAVVLSAPAAPTARLLAGLVHAATAYRS